MPVIPARPVLRPRWLDRPTLGEQALIGTTVVLVWLTLEWLTQRLLTAPGVSGWYPPAGLGVAVFWALGWRYVWALGAACWLGLVLVWRDSAEALLGLHLAYSSAQALVKVGLYSAVGLGLGQLLPALAPLRRPGQMALALLPLLGCAMLGAFAWIGLRWAMGLPIGGSFSQAVLGWAVGDMVGLLIVAPLLVLVVLPGVCRWWLTRGRAATGTGESLPTVPGAVGWPACWGAIVGVIAAGLYAWPESRDLHVIYLGFVAVPVLAAVYGLSGGLVALTVVNVFCMAAVGWSGAGFDELLATQLILVAMAVSALMVGAVATLRDQAELDAQRERRWTALALRGGGLGRWQWAVGSTEFVSDYVLTDKLGYPREMVRHDTRWWRPRVHPEDDNARRESLRRCLAGDTPYHDAENRILDAQGRWVWYRTQGEVIQRDEAGRPTVLAGTHREITERKRLEALEQAAEATHRSEKRFRALADASPVGVFQTDTHGALLYVNPAWTHATGITMADALYRHAPAFAHADDRDAVSDHWDAALRLNAPLRCEMRLDRDDKKTRWVSMQASPVPADQNNPRGFVGTVVDITDYRERVALIEDSEARYRTLAEHANDMLWRVTGDAVFSYVSPSVQPLLGYPPEQMVGTDAFHYFHPDDVQRVRDKHAKLTPDNPVFIDTHRYRRSDGSYIVFDAVGQLVTPEENDQPPYIVGISRDVTRRIEAEHHREELEQRLIQSQKLDALGGFARGVAHDFRNTLLAINSSAQSATKQLPPGHPARDPLAIVEEACRQAGEITQSLLTFARGQGASKQALDLGQVLRETARLLNAVLPPRVTVRCHTPQGPPIYIEGNRAELEQVLMNLATNAQDAMPDGGTITLTLSNNNDDPDNPRCQLVVQDTGEGMATDVRDRAFEPFFTTKPRLKGTGLGLALVHGVVETHRGNVTLDSEPGQGTTVTLGFPLTRPPAEQSPPSPIHPLPETTAS